MVADASAASIAAAVFSSGSTSGSRTEPTSNPTFRSAYFSGIGLVVTLLVRAQRGGARLLATGLSDHYREILSLTRLDEAIEIHPDEAAALAAAEG